MYIYRCLHNQVSQPMKSIYFETIPVDRGKEITYLFNQVQTLENLSNSIFKRVKNPSLLNSDDHLEEKRPLLTSGLDINGS